jgi:1-deoxy-D-xylulose-5-phosphate synthase
MNMVATSAALGDRPSAFRYPRGEGLGLPLPARGEILQLGRGRILREGSRVAILSLGTRLAEALRAADQLASHGYSTTVADARFAKPIDTALVEQLARNHEMLITVEEASAGGFGAAVMHHLAWRGLLDGGLRFRPMTLPDRFVDHASPAVQIAEVGLDAKAMVRTVLDALAAVGEREIVRL